MNKSLWRKAPSSSGAVGRKKRRGFSLVEIAIVLGVVVLGVSGIWGAASVIRYRVGLDIVLNSITTSVQGTRQDYRGFCKSVQDMNSTQGSRYIIDRGFVDKRLIKNNNEIRLPYGTLNEVFVDRLDLWIRGNDLAIFWESDGAGQPTMWFQINVGAHPSRGEDLIKGLYRRLPHELAIVKCNGGGNQTHNDSRTPENFLTQKCPAVSGAGIYVYLYITFKICG